jgi:hypothetical protein
MSDTGPEGHGGGGRWLTGSEQPRWPTLAYLRGALVIYLIASLLAAGLFFVVMVVVTLTADGLNGLGHNGSWPITAVWPLMELHLRQAHCTFS